MLYAPDSMKRVSEDPLCDDKKVDRALKALSVKEYKKFDSWTANMNVVCYTLLNVLTSISLP